jgi:hypothetical protein
MHWIYIFKCENEHYYVGETTRLYRRFWEHYSGIGGLNTSVYKPECLVAIYKLNTLSKFFEYNNNVMDTINKNYTLHNQCEYNKWLLQNFDNDDDDDKYFDNLYAENNIVECLMINDSENWKKIRGGKYTRFDIDYKYPTNEYIDNLPVCICGLPCDIKKNNDYNYLFFRCPKKNIWEGLREEFDLECEPCSFYMEYKKDKQFRLEEKQKFEDRTKILKELFKKSFWLKNIDCEKEDEINKCVSCNKYVWCDREGNFKNNGVIYENIHKLLCYDCFIDKNEELSKKYIDKGKCLLKIKPIQPLVSVPN